MTTTNYIWDEQNYLAEADETNTINVVYTNEPQQYGNLISTRLPVSGTPTTVYHHFDALGSTRQLSTGTGFVSDTVIYDAWGNAIDRTGSTAVMLLWVGELGYYFDPETTYYWIRVRPLDARMGQWLATDPIQLHGGRSRFEYASNRPLVAQDPSGKVDVIFTPGQTKDVPWRIDYREPTTTMAFTVTGRRPFVSVRCSECCYCGKRGPCCSIGIIIEVHNTVYINCRGIHANDADVSGAYGHEQQHIENIRRFVNELARRALRVEQKYDCRVTQNECTTPFPLGDNPRVDDGILSLERDMERFLENEMRHDPTPGFPLPPSRGSSVPPIGGTMPRKSVSGKDCSDPPYY